MSKFKSHDHYANQTAYTQPDPQKKVKAKPTSPRSKPPRQAEEATSPSTDTSNGGM